MRQVYEVTLPISDIEADMAGMPAEWFDWAVRRLGKLTRLEDVEIPTIPNTVENSDAPE